MASEGGGLDAVADELYSLPMAEFTASRDARAAAARQAGDRELAGEIKKLRRPTVGAWLTNQLVRQRRADVEALLRLGSALHDAQAELATDDLRRLSQQAQQVVTALGRQARTVAADAGQRVGDSAVREVEETLHAGLADPAAGEAVRAGRLTSPLSYAGFGSVDVFGAAPGVSTASATPATPAPPVAAARADAKAQAQAEAARKAQTELDDARQDADDRARRLEEAGQDRERADQRVQELSEELEQAQRVAREAATAARDAERAYREAERRVARAQAAVAGQAKG